LSRHRKDLRGAPGHGLFGLCVNPSLGRGRILYHRSFSAGDNPICKQSKYFIFLSCSVILETRGVWKTSNFSTG